MGNDSPSIIHEVADALELVLAKHSPAIDVFLSNYTRGNWIIASDYCIEQSADTLTMTFALIPITTQTKDANWVARFLPWDFKDAPYPLPPGLVHFLRYGEFLVFNFVLSRPIELMHTAEKCALSLRNSIADLEAHPQAMHSVHREIINKLKGALREERANSFKRKCNEVVLLGALGAMIAMRAATRESPLREVYWSPDRDNMTGVWDGLAHHVFQVNLCAGLDEKGLHQPLKLARFDDVGREPVNEPYIRIADYFAGPISMSQRNWAARSSKCNQVLDEVFADNPRILNIGLRFFHDGTQRKISVTDVVLSPSDMLPGYESCEGASRIPK